MATKSLSANAPNQSYTDGANWVGGVAPTTGDTVLISVAPPNGPITATNLAITGEAITLSDGGQFYTTGTSSFDAATTLTDTNGATNNDIQFGDFFTNGGTIVNANYITVVNTTANGAENPVFTNSGTLSFTTNVGGDGISPYVVNAYNSVRPAVVGFDNTGVINVVAPAGANEGPTATTLDTQVQITGVSTGTGTVNVDGSALNQTGAISGTAPTESVLEYEQAVQGTQTFNLNDGEIQFDAGSSGTVVFQDSTGILDIANPVTTANTLTIDGFHSGDAIGLGTTSITRAAYDTTTGEIDLFNAANTMVGALNIVATGTQNYATATFTVVPYSTATPSNVQAADALLPTSNSPRQQNYLEVNAAAPCYCPGTAIRTDRGDVAVEDLAIGDRVITLDGTAEPIKWIGRRAFAGRFIENRRDILPVSIRAGALGAGLPRRDLHISPLHAMYLDGVLVPAAELVNGVSITQASAVERVEYIHIELERHQVIWAEGAASESFVDDYSRAMFHNVHEFAALYPGQAPTAAAYCAPRVEAGNQLAAIKRDIDRLAGLAVPGQGDALDGRVDALDKLVLTGWAQNPDKPEAPICLDVFVDGVAVARTVANLFRPDLLAAGLGSGCHSFSVRLPRSAKLGRIEVRRLSDGAAVGTLDLRRPTAA